jgi:hypothetical protein
MKLGNLKYFSLFFLFLCNFNSKAQNKNVIDSTKHKKVSNIIPRMGIGMSRYFISEFGIAYMRSNFTDHKNLGLNTNNLIYYFSFETMTPYKKPFIYGYKIGIETINFGHVTSAGGIEIGYYQKDTISSLVVTPRIGIPLINGSLAYGIGLYFNPDMRREIGRHRITLTYCFNRKSDKAFNSMLAKQKNKNR